MNLDNLRIAISGKSGCGNTTVSKLVADTLGLRFINFTFRNLAAERGITLEEVLSLAQEDEYWDNEVDRRQVELARQDGGCVLGSRLAIWMLPEADLKVYLQASLPVRARRIQKREGGDLKDIMHKTQVRDSQDHERYLKLYGIDNDRYEFVDLVIDTDNRTPAEIVEIILERVRNLRSDTTT